MGLSVGQRILLWMILPVLAGVAVVVGPELVAIAAVAGEAAVAKREAVAVSD